MANPNIAEAGKATRWQKGFAPPGAGRRTSRIKQFAIDNGLTNTDVSDAIKLIIDMTEQEMQDFSEDKTKPMILRGFTHAVLAEIKKHGIQNIIMLIERVFGKPKESVEHSGGVNHTVMTREEKEQLIKDLEKTTGT